MKKAEFKKKIKKFDRLKKLKFSGKYLSIVDYFVTFRRDWEEELTAIDDFITQEITKAEKEILEKVKQFRLELEGTEEMVKLDPILYKMDDLIKKIDNYLERKKMNKKEIMNLEIAYMKVIIADLLSGMTDRRITIENQVEMLREIADSLEKEYKNILKKGAK